MWTPMHNTELGFALKLMSLLISSVGMATIQGTAQENKPNGSLLKGLKPIWVYAEAWVIFHCPQLSKAKNW